MTVKGTVSSIIFYNSENGYTVLSLSADDGDDYIVVGNLPALSLGAVLTVTGRFAYHQRYGEQLVAETFSVGNPTTQEGIVKYLSSGLIKGVGEVTARNIYDAFGSDALGVIENNPDRLTNVKGISPKKAMDIANSVAELKLMQNSIMFLQKYEVTVNLALKIYNVYKENTVSVVKENPYKLVDDIDGVGFATADKIARSMGHAPDSEFRVRAAIVYTLKDTAEKQGNTYLYCDELANRCSEILQLDLSLYTELFENTLTKLVLESLIKTFDSEDRRAVALVRYYALEQGVATYLTKLSHNAKRLLLDIDSSIKNFEEVNGISFHKGQAEAVRSALINGVTVITGGPGTGKTTIIKCIAEAFLACGLRVEFCAPTGRAAKRLSQSSGKEAKTIHRLLGYEFAGGKMNFKYNRYNTLPCDVVIVDELSMADVNVTYSLLQALESGTRLVLVGDKDQLPSVGAGNVLADIIRSGVIEIRYLTYIYRQSEDSLIVSNAHLINKCNMPVIDNSSKDFFMMDIDNLSNLTDTVVQLVKTRLPKFTQVPSREIQVLGALKSGVAGVDNLNLRLQDALNPKSKEKNEISFGTRIFREGDRIMQVVNNYETEYVEYKADKTAVSGMGVFNGDIGFVSKINKTSGMTEITFDDGRVAQYSEPELADIRLAYAATVHKSQGSEFDVVVVPLVNGPPTIINKNLLYTAITRARKVVVLAGSKRVLAMMVRNNYVAKRTTLLARFLKEQKYKFDTFFEN